MNRGYKGMIFIMDDEAMIRRITGAILRKAGYQVWAFPDGEALLNSLKRQRPDLIIMDLMVPDGMGGVETMSALQRVEPEIETIVFSGYINHPVMKDYRQYGFKGALPKPFKIKELLDLVTELFPDLSRGSN